MNATGIQQTKELLVALAGIVHDVLAANTDGKITNVEAFKLAFGNAGDVVTACVGISDVPAELADIHPDEVDTLYHAVIGALGWEENTIHRDVFDTLFTFVFHGINAWRVLQNTLAPPKAEVVPEPPAPPVTQ